MNAISHAQQRRNQVRPVSVVVNDAASGKIPARITSIPERTIISTICTNEEIRATRPSRMTISTGCSAPAGWLRQQRREDQRPEVLPEVGPHRGAVDDPLGEAVGGLHGQGHDRQPCAGHGCQGHQRPQDVLAGLGAHRPRHPCAADHHRQHRRGGHVPPQRVLEESHRVGGVVARRRQVRGADVHPHGGQVRQHRPDRISHGLGQRAERVTDDAIGDLADGAVERPRRAQSSTGGVVVMCRSTARIRPGRASPGSARTGRRRSLCTTRQSSRSQRRVKAVWAVTVWASVTPSRARSITVSSSV